MAKSGARKLAVHQVLAENRRQLILQLLKIAPGWTMNERVIYNALPQLGHLPSADQLRNDLMWLNEVLLIELNMEASVWAATLLQRGLEVAECRVKAYGVASQPSPLE